MMLFVVFSLHDVFSHAECFFPLRGRPSLVFSLTRNTRNARNVYTRYRLCILRDENIRQSWPTGVSAANAFRVFRAFRVRKTKGILPREKKQRDKRLREAS